MRARFNAALLAAAAVLLLVLLACSAQAQDAQHLWNRPGHGKRPRPGASCVGTTERPARLITLSSGHTFCLRLPRFLKNPEMDVLGTKKFARTYQDTCGLYGIVFSTFVKQGGGPPPHIHHADHEWFLPGTPGDVVRVHAQAASKVPYRQYKAGQVPGFNMPPITVGGVEVGFGGIGYSPPDTPHTWKAATNMTSFMAVWEFGWAMNSGVNIPESDPDPVSTLEKTGLWGVPTDTTGGMFGGLEFATNARGPLAIPAPTITDLQRLQSLFDKSEAPECCKGAC